VIDGQIPCVNVVEMVTDWMEGALDDETRALVEEHLVLCAPCGAYVRQIRQAMQAMRVLDSDATPPAAHQALLQAFRSHHDH
jgi:predicted anti-sigma-YlaC factor YlaD